MKTDFTHQSNFLPNPKGILGACASFSLYVILIQDLACNQLILHLKTKTKNKKTKNKKQKQKQKQKQNLLFIYFLINICEISIMP
jgi:hypothetical protein